jgi:hypothetical protein
MHVSGLSIILVRTEMEICYNTGKEKIRTVPPLERKGHINVSGLWGILLRSNDRRYIQNINHSRTKHL